MNSHFEKRTQFSDIPYDLITVIKNHVTNFQNNDEEYNFLSNFKEGKNKDMYKFFFNKEPYYFVTEVVTQRSSIEPDTYKYKYKFYLDHVNVANILQYVNNKYTKNYDTITIVVKYRNGIKNKKIDRKYIAIGYGCIVINYNNNNKLQFSPGGDCNRLSYEYNIPDNLKTYLNNNVWNKINIF